MIIGKRPMNKVNVEIADLKIFYRLSATDFDLSFAVHIVPHLAHHDDIFPLYDAFSESFFENVAYLFLVAVN